MDPKTEYGRRLKLRCAAAAECETWHLRIGNARLAIFLIAAAIAWFSFQANILSAWWLLLPACAFLALAIQHSRVLQNLQHAKRAIDFYERGLARMEDRWEGAGERGDRFRDSSHPYAEDLDLFGKGSLFELLCIARTLLGEQTLASWLKNPSAESEILSRQDAVNELRSNIDLREDLAVLGADVRAGVDPDPLVQWSQGSGMLASNAIRVLAAFLALIAAAAAAIWIILGNHLLFLLVVFIDLIFAFILRTKIRQAVNGAASACRDLELLSLALARLEKEQFKTNCLTKLRSALNNDGLRPSQLIARLNFLIVLLDSRKNALFAPVAFLLQWEIQLAFFIEAWRKKNGHAIAGWLAAVAEMEALSCLAGYAYEHPSDPFPELCSQPPCFNGQGLGHPLLSESRCIRNDVSLTDGLRALVVSGSNMSGKSTLLRTVGINAVLALAGAPVRARRLQISPLTIGASIRTMDSLQEGTSRFYAEITRLQKLVILAGGPAPLLFLLDELLHGTNSHDRRIGAEAVIGGLVRRGAIGLLTTHDLALSHIAETLAPHAANVHFEDRIEDGRIKFDYHLQPGIVRKSNALELMRSIGLEV